MWGTPPVQDIPVSQAEFARAKQRYQSAQERARRQAAVNLIEPIGISFYLTNWSHRALHAHAAQWLAVGARPHSEGGWDWDAIYRRYRTDMSAMDIVIWGPGDRLSGLSLVTANSISVSIGWIEGDPRPDCPLVGKRLLITLEAAACYAQALGRREIHLKPLNDTLADLYRTVYGFALEKPRKGAPYYRKEV